MERLHVVRCVFDLPVEFGAEDVAQALEDTAPRVSRATIFRTLTQMTTVGMLARDGFCFRRLPEE
jgi:Fe2+ or Zn2+ uptake regulation protein